MNELLDRNALAFGLDGARSEDLEQRIVTYQSELGETDGGHTLLAGAHRRRAAILRDHDWRPLHLDVAWQYERLAATEVEVAVHATSALLEMSAARRPHHGLFSEALALWVEVGNSAARTSGLRSLTAAMLLAGDAYSAARVLSQAVQLAQPHGHDDLADLYLQIHDLPEWVFGPAGHLVPDGATALDIAEAHATRTTDRRYAVEVVVRRHHEGAPQGWAGEMLAQLLGEPGSSS